MEIDDVVTCVHQYELVPLWTRWFSTVCLHSKWPLCSIRTVSACYYTNFNNPRRDALKFSRIVSVPEVCILQWIHIIIKLSINFPAYDFFDDMHVHINKNSTYLLETPALQSLLQCLDQRLQHVKSLHIPARNNAVTTQLMGPHDFKCVCDAEKMEASYYVKWISPWLFCLTQSYNTS